MSAIGQLIGQGLLDYLNRTIAFPSITALHMGLSSTVNTATDGSGLSELSYPDYDREVVVQANDATSTFAAADAANRADIQNEVLFDAIDTGAGVQTVREVFFVNHLTDAVSAANFVFSITVSTTGLLFNELEQPRVPVDTNIFLQFNSLTTT